METRKPKKGNTVSIIEVIDEHIEKLNSFGSSKEVALYLESEQAKGYKGDSDSCVITNWLEDKTGLDISTDEEIRFYDRDDLLSVADISNAVKDFIVEFDNGQYPHLEWGYGDD